MHLGDFLCASLDQYNIPGLRGRWKVLRLVNVICKIWSFSRQNVANFSTFVAKFQYFCGKIRQNLWFQMAIFHDARSTFKEKWSTEFLWAANLEFYGSVNIGNRRLSGLFIAQE